MQDLARLGIGAGVVVGGLRGGEECERAAREVGPQPQALQRGDQRIAAERGAVPRHAGVRKRAGRQRGGQHVEVGPRALEPAVHHRVGTGRLAAPGVGVLHVVGVALPGVVVAERRRVVRARCLARHLPADAALLTRLHAQCEARHARAGLRGHRLELHHGATRPLVQAEVAEHQRRGVALHLGALAAPLALHAAQLEHVDEVGIEPQLDLELHRVDAMVREAHLLVAGTVPQQLAPQHVHAALAQRDAAVALQIGVHQLDGQRAAVFLHRGVQVQRTRAVEQQLRVRQEARVLKVQPLLPALPRQDVAIAVEQREQVVALQGLQLPLDARTGGEDVPASLELDAIALADAGDGHVRSSDRQLARGVGVGQTRQCRAQRLVHRQIALRHAA